MRRHAQKHYIRLMLTVAFLLAGLLAIGAPLAARVSCPDAPVCEQMACDDLDEVRTEPAELPVAFPGIQATAPQLVTFIHLHCPSFVFQPPETV